jgi:uncharacterized membrane protein
VAVTVDRIYPRLIHPLHAVLLAGTIPLFLGALLSDIAYFASYQIQWKNFASWLIAGGLVFAGLALLWALVGLFRAGERRRAFIYFLLLLVTWVVAFADVLVHAKDAWASMPEALILSAIVVVLTIAANAVGFSTPRVREV